MIAMNIDKLIDLGLNKNEAKIYLALLENGSSIASALVKVTGVHRNIVYDNLDKLVQKGLVSCINENNKKVFFAEKSTSLIEVIEKEEEELSKKKKKALELIPEINEILENADSKQDVTLFKGIQGIKQIILDSLDYNEYWVIGVSNASIELLGESFWKNFNIKRKSSKTKEYLLYNPDFNNSVNIEEKNSSFTKKLPTELNQVTEIFLYNKKVAIIVYSHSPIGIVIENKHIFSVFKNQFEFLWKLSK